MTVPLVTGPAAPFLPPGVEVVLMHCDRPMMALRMDGQSEPVTPVVTTVVHYGCAARCGTTVDITVRRPL